MYITYTNQHVIHNKDVKTLVNNTGRARKMSQLRDLTKFWKKQVDTCFWHTVNVHLT